MANETVLTTPSFSLSLSLSLDVHTGFSLSLSLARSRRSYRSLCVQMADTTCASLNVTIKKFKNGNNDNDRLRRLPESVLGHILSLLPTKDAVGTSVLSTKWRYMWTLATNLDFDDTLKDSRRRKISRLLFSNFVERVLLLQGNSTIESFNLSCSQVYDESRVNSWISTAIRRNAKRLRIHNFRVKPGFVFPRCIHEIKSLTELELRMPCVLRVPPSSTFLSSLKVLSLNEVFFQTESFSLSNQLHLSFPMLEIFDLVDCEWMNVEFVDIYAPALEVFSVSCKKWRPVSMLDCVVNIKGSSITKFQFHGSSFTSQYNLCSPSSVVDASIVVSTLASNLGKNHEFGLRTFSLLNQFSNVKNLTLSSPTVMALSYLEDLHNRLPTFDKLINLTFTEGHHVIDVTLMTFLRSSPALESLVLEEGISLFNQEEVVLGTVPQCLMSQLKVVAIHFHYGRYSRDEVEAVKFFLKNAQVLEKMTITGCHLPQNEKTKNELLTFPKGSCCATLLFS